MGWKAIVSFIALTSSQNGNLCKKIKGHATFGYTQWSRMHCRHGCKRKTTEWCQQECVPGASYMPRTSANGYCPLFSKRNLQTLLQVSKGLYGDQVNGYSSLPYFCGSPPSRSDNPLVHDVQFIRKGLPSPAVNVSQKSSCGASFGAKPLVRVEGFSCSSSETRCIVPALA